MSDHERRMEQMSQARKQHHESEWRLNFLRTIEAQPQPQPTDEEIIKCYIHRQQPAQLSN
jgi:hypothetical protein